MPRRQRVVACATHQVPARFRPRPMTDSPLSARSTSLRFNFADYISTSLRSDGRKLSRQSEKVVRARGQQAARLRPAKTSAIARDASHGQDIGITARGSACRRGRGNNREIGHFCTASISQAALQRTETAELTGKTRLV